MLLALAISCMTCVWAEGDDVDMGLDDEVEGPKELLVRCSGFTEPPCTVMLDIEQVKQANGATKDAETNVNGDMQAIMGVIEDPAILDDAESFKDVMFQGGADNTFNKHCHHDVMKALLRFMGRHADDYAEDGARKVGEIPKPLQVDPNASKEKKGLDWVASAALMYNLKELDGYKEHYNADVDEIQTLYNHTEQVDIKGKFYFDPAEVYNLINCANFLGYKRYINVVAAYIASLITNQKPEELPKILDPKNHAK